MPRSPAMSVALPLPFYLSRSVPLAFPIALPLPLPALEWHGARVKRLKCVGMGLNQGE